MNDQHSSWFTVGAVCRAFTMLMRENTAYESSQGAQAIECAAFGRAN